MGIYVFIEAILGIIAGILLALFTKKADGITYGKLDEAGVIMNSVFLPLYAVATPACIILGLLCRPNHDGFLGILVKDCKVLECNVDEITEITAAKGENR